MGQPGAGLGEAGGGWRFVRRLAMMVLTLYVILAAFLMTAIFIYRQPTLARYEWATAVLSNDNRSGIGTGSADLVQVQIGQIARRAWVGG